MSGDLDQETIVELFVSGALTACVFSYANFDDKDSTFALYAELHNCGKIDLFSLTQGSQFESVSQQSFFAGQHFFCEVIPKLQASAGEMMRCVSRLVKKAGQDLAANQPNAAFRQWCSRDPVRAQEVIRLAKAGDALAFEFLTFALEAGQFFEEALEILQIYSDGRRLSAITAISRMKLQNEELVRRALDAFLKVLEKEEDDALFANVLGSAFELVAKKDSADLSVLEIVRHVSKRPGPQVHFCSARIMWMHTELLTEELFSLLADALKSLDPTHKLTIHELDSGLRHLLGTSLSAKGVELLGDLLVSYPQAIKVSDFESFGHKLLEKPEGEFQKILVSWLISGEKSLCDALSHLVGAYSLDDKPITLSAENLELTQVKQIVLCRKAVGFFFFQPVFAASIVVSVLRVCSEETSATLRHILLDPLLRNYGGKLREFLSSIEEEDRARPAVKFALDENDSYLAEIQDAGEIRELSPSEVQKQAVRRIDSDEVRRSHKEAMKKSVLLSLVHRSVILYGRRTLTVVEGPGDERRLMQMDLKSHSFGWELPRVTIIDPVGLDFMLRVFRNERLRDEAYSS
jgi:hypothetical protein